MNSVMGDATFASSIVEGGATGENNLDLDPLFIGAATGDLHLSYGSLAIDHGDSSVLVHRFA